MNSDFNGLKENIITKMTSYKERLKQFDDLLRQQVIDLKTLRSLCFQGIPDKPSLRSLLWKILLHYLSANKGEWNEKLRKQRLSYKHYVAEIVAHPSDADREKEIISDHPLNMNADSHWKSYFKDNEVLLQIDRDVRRLCPDISFFQRATSYPIHHVLDDPGPFETLTTRVDRAMLNTSVIGISKGGLRNVIIKKCRNEDYAVLPEGQEAHWQVVERVLFIYAKLNPGLSYVQGMNEIIGPIYHTFASDPDLEWQEHAEADCFFCFSNLMGEIRDYFIKKLDDTPDGIGCVETFDDSLEQMFLQLDALPNANPSERENSGAHMNKLFCLLQVKDEELWTDLKTKEMKPQFFAFRWITLLLSQEFLLPDVIRLWDSLFADASRFGFLLYVCVAMLVLLRDQILENDFAKTMKLLQNFPHEDFDMATILGKAVELRMSSNSKNTIPTGKPVSNRGMNLKKRLSLFAKNGNK